MRHSNVPAALLSRVKSELQPVRPLASPGRRALALVPLGIALMVGIPVFWAWYAHINVFAPWPWRGLSLIEALVGVLVLAAAFREAVPGRELSRQTVWIVLGGACASFLIVNLSSAADANVPAETVMRWLRECIGRVIAFSAPALAIPIWLVSRALPNRPALTGAFCGLGVGLMADAGLRMLCWDGEHAHIVIAHGGAIAVLMALGALSTTMLERMKR
jgi:hypothetical protein